MSMEPDGHSMALDLIADLRSQISSMKANASAQVSLQMENIRQHLLAFSWIARVLRPLLRTLIQRNAEQAIQSLDEEAIEKTLAEAILSVGRCEQIALAVSSGDGDLIEDPVVRRALFPSEPASEGSAPPSGSGS